MTRLHRALFKYENKIKIGWENQCKTLYFTQIRSCVENGDILGWTLYTIINKKYPGYQLGNYHQKRVRVNEHYFVVMENRQFPSMPRTRWSKYSKQKLATMNRFCVFGGSLFAHTPLTYWSKTISRKLTTKATFGVNFIYPKLRDWVAVKEDDKISCHKKGGCIKTKQDHLYRNV